MCASQGDVFQHGPLRGAIPDSNLATGAREGLCGPSRRSAEPRRRPAVGVSSAAWRRPCSTPCPFRSSWSSSASSWRGPSSRDGSSAARRRGGAAVPGQWRQTAPVPSRTAGTPGRVVRPSRRPLHLRAVAVARPRPSCQTMPARGLFCNALHSDATLTEYYGHASRYTLFMLTTFPSATSTLYCQVSSLYDTMKSSRPTQGGGLT